MAIVVCQLQLWRRSRRGLAERPSFRLIGAPYTSVATLLFLVGVVVLMAFSNDDVQRGFVSTAKAFDEGVEPPEMIFHGR